MYTVENSINDILNDEVVMEHFEFMLPRDFLEMVPENMRDMHLSKVKEQISMPWNVPYISEELIESVNQIRDIIDTDAYSFIKLWSSDTPEEFFASTDGKKEHVGMLKLNDSFKSGRKMALVVPGGAYMNVAISGEGIGTAKWLEKAGYAVVVMNYRVSPSRYPAPQLDLALAIKRMRLLAKEYNLQDELAVIGFSAGGHLVASEACYYEEIEKLLLDELKDDEKLLKSIEGISARPDKVGLTYPVIDFISEQHEDSFINLTGGDEALRYKLSIDLHVTKDYPKTFVWACDDDDLVPPSNAKRMYEAVKNAGVDAAYRSYPTGGHGCATGVGTSAEGWVDEMVEFFA